MKGVPIPARMAHLPKDRRGYPIPTMVLVDDGGRPHFQINDEHVRQRLIKQDRCAICGQKLFRGRWFVGGPMSCFSERGSYIDPPLHAECAAYALAVCPYLAAPAYGREIGAKTLQGRPMADAVRINVDPTMIKDRPTYFVAVMAVGQDVIRHRDSPTPAFGYGDNWVRYVKPRIGSVREIHIWQTGSRVSDPAAVGAFTEGVWASLAEHGDAGRSDIADLWRALK